MDQIVLGYFMFKCSPYSVSLSVFSPSILGAVSIIMSVIIKKQVKSPKVHQKQYTFTFVCLIYVHVCIILVYFYYRPTRRAAFIIRTIHAYMYLHVSMCSDLNGLQY